VQLGSGASVIAETAFNPQFHTARFADLIARYGADVVQIWCVAETDVLCRRFSQRCETGERHPGHVDHLETHRRFAADVQSGKYASLDIGGLLIESDMTDFSAVDYGRIRTAVETAPAQMASGQRLGA
jgi:hypothetical protein